MQLFCRLLLVICILVLTGLPPVLFDPESGELVDPPVSLDYFAIFGLKKSFTLNTDELSICKAAKC